MENKTEEKNIKAFKRVCPYCKFGIISMYKKQLDQNLQVHMLTCNENPVIKKRNQEKNGNNEKNN